MIARMRKFPFVLLTGVCLLSVALGAQDFEDEYDQEYQDIVELSDADIKLRFESLKNIFSDLDDLKPEVDESESDEYSKDSLNELREEDNNEDTVYQTIDENIPDVLDTDTKDDEPELRSPYDRTKTKVEESNTNSLDETLGDVEAGKVVGISYDGDGDLEERNSLAEGQEQMVDLSNPQEAKIVEEIHGNSVEDIKGMFDEDDGDDERENVDINNVNNDVDANLEGHEGIGNNDEKINNVYINIHDSDISSMGQKNDQEISKDDDVNDRIGDDEIAEDVEQENDLSVPETTNVRNNLQSMFNNEIDESGSDEDEDSDAIDEDIPDDALDLEVKAIKDEGHYENYEGIDNIGNDEMRNDDKEISVVEEVPVDDIIFKPIFNDIDNVKEFDENYEANESISDEEIRNHHIGMEDVGEVPLKDISKGMFDEDNNSDGEVIDSDENDKINDRNKDEKELGDEQEVKYNERVAAKDEIVKGLFDDEIDTAEEVAELDDVSDNVGEDEKQENIIEENQSSETEEQNDKDMYDEEYVEDENKMLNEEIRKVMQEIDEVEADLKEKFGYEYVDDNEEANIDEDDKSGEEPNEDKEVGNVSLFKILEEVSPIRNQDEETVDEPAFNVDFISDSVQTNARFAVSKDLNDTQEIVEPTSTTTESSVEESVNVVELSPDTRITLTSPSYPEPYQNNVTMEWQLTGDSGTGIEINITKTDLDGDSDDYLLIKPGHVDSNTDSIIFTFNIDEELRYRFHDYNEAYVRFVSTPKPAENQQYQGFTLSAKFIDQIQEVTTTTEAPIPLPEDTHRVFLGGTTPSNFLNISEDFRQILVDMITMYANEKGIDTGIVSVQEVLQITSVTSCQMNWPDNDNCVAVRYGASFVYDETQYPSDEARSQEMSEGSLIEMWNAYQRQDPFATRLQRLGVWDFAAPDDAAVLTLWLLISGAVVMAMVLLSYAIWRWNCFEEYTAMSRYSDTESVMSRKSDASLYPTPHQNLPPMFATPRDSFGIWSDQLPPKYEDPRFPEPGRSYDNRSFVRDGEFFDLESDEEIVMSLPDGPGAKYQMNFPQRNKDAEA